MNNEPQVQNCSQILDNKTCKFRLHSRWEKLILFTYDLLIQQTCVGDIWKIKKNITVWYISLKILSFMSTLNINIYVIQLLYNMLLFNGKMVNLSSQYGHFSVSFSSSWTLAICFEVIIECKACLIVITFDLYFFMDS